MKAPSGTSRREGPPGAPVRERIRLPAAAPADGGPRVHHAEGRAIHAIRRPARTPRNRILIDAPLLVAGPGIMRAAWIGLVSSLGQAPVDFDDVMLEHGYQGMPALMPFEPRSRARRR
jgi:hypothetical protein